MAAVAPPISFDSLSPAPDATAGEGDGIIVYSNTGSNVPFPPGSTKRIADDLFLTAICGCELAYYEITVNGGGSGAGPGFSVTHALYVGCPSDGGQVLPGTEATTVLPNNGTHTVRFNYEGDPLELPSTLFLAVQFSTNQAGWLVGKQPEIGYSNDAYDYPTFDCNARFGGTPYFASFAARLACLPTSGPEITAPSPVDGAEDVPVETLLTWNTPTAAVAHVPKVQIPADRPQEHLIDGTTTREEQEAAFRAAIEAGEIPDPSTKPLPQVAPRSYFGGVAGGGPKPITSGDIFLWEDEFDILAEPTHSDGARTNMMVDATNAVLKQYGDNFDFVGFFLSFHPGQQFGAAYYQFIENDVSGIGTVSGGNIFNSRPLYGIAGDHVEGFIMMWDIGDWSPSFCPDPTLQYCWTQLVLGQEFEHRFGLFLNPILGNRPLQGNNGNCGRSVHWNWKVDAQGSGMEVSEWVGSSPAIPEGLFTSFNSDIPGGVFSYPDLYLMGYVTPTEMNTGASELRYMDNSDCSSAYFGNISTWSSADIISSNGVRSPNAFGAQKNFSTAWVMIHRPNQLPTTQQLQDAVNILNAWTNVWSNSTLGRGTMSNSLTPTPLPGPCEATYDVLFGTVNPPEQVICDDVYQPRSCNPGPLKANTTYYWRTVGEDVDGVTQGPVWSFTTAPACRIVSSSPTSCAIDARQPHDLNNADSLEGWQSLSIDFECAVSSSPPDSELDFSINSSVTESPTIVDVDVNGSTVTLVLSEPIPVGQWTCITYNETGEQVCLGYLPGDVDEDGTAAAPDIMALVDALNLRFPRLDHSTDLDRSGEPGAPDILREIDLLNGAGEFEEWRDRSIGDCPAVQP